MSAGNRLTVLGASGLIGARVIEEARHQDLEVLAPTRDEDLGGRDLGHVIDCVGITSDFRTRPFDTIEAHVCRVARLLSASSSRSYLYLSSTRLYRRTSPPASEAGPIGVDPAVAEELYDASKLMGEAIALSTSGAARVARLSNVYGLEPVPGSFLTDVVDAAIRDGHVTLRTALASSKDYLHVEDAARALLHIALDGRHRIYNVASGSNVRNDELLDALQRVVTFGHTVEPGAPVVEFPPLDISRLQAEMPFRPRALGDQLPEIAQRHRSMISASGV